jgi:hypothetical protein
LAYLTDRAPLAAAILAAVLLAGCGKTTVFKSNFDQTPVGQAPAVTQGVGTAAVVGGLSQVAIATAPELPGRWVSIGRPKADTSFAAFQGKLAEPPKEGRYTFTATLLIPEGAGVSTVQFERVVQPANDPAGFLHLDFMPETNKVRLDDDAATDFGEFPRGRPFLVQVTLTTGPTSTARIVLSGDGATGAADRTILTAFSPQAREFGAIRLWMGPEHLGEFKAANVVVTRGR